MNEHVKMPCHSIPLKKKKEIWCCGLQSWAAGVSPFLLPAFPSVPLPLFDSAQQQ